MPKVIDLFSGCGGMSWGLYNQGFEILAAIDKWEVALSTFKHNHPNATIVHSDIRKLDTNDVMQQLQLKAGELDCLLGGPPCQGFSKNVPASYRFLEDERNLLYHDFLRFVKVLRPKTLILENVAEIYRAYSGSVRREIAEQLELLGYQVNVKVLSAADYGIPQRRKRCFFFASRTGVWPEFPVANFGESEARTFFDTIKPYRSAWDAISDLPVLENGEGYEPMRYTYTPENEYQAFMRTHDDFLYDHVTRKLNDKQFKRITSLAPGQGIKDLPDELRPKSGYSGAYGRLDFGMVAPTITRWFFHPGSGRFCHPREVRLLTIREGARIQSFTDDFRFCGTYIEKSHQLGNAVPPLLISAFADSIKRCLGA